MRRMAVVQQLPFHHATYGVLLTYAQVNGARQYKKSCNTHMLSQPATAAPGRLEMHLDRVLLTTAAKA